MQNNRTMQYKTSKKKKLFSQKSKKTNGTLEKRNCKSFVISSSLNFPLRLHRRANERSEKGEGEEEEKREKGEEGTLVPATRIVPQNLLLARGDARFRPRAARAFPSFPSSLFLQPLRARRPRLMLLL